MKRFDSIIAGILGMVAAVVVEAGTPTEPPPPWAAGSTKIRVPVEPRIDPGVDRKVLVRTHPAELSAATPGTAPVSVNLADVPLASPDELGPWRSVSHIQGESPLDEQSTTDGKEHGRGVAGSPTGPSPAPDQPAQNRAAGDFVYHFNGISDTGWIPPDTIHAVGPDHVVTATNSHFAVYSKLGNVKRNLTSFNTFFNSLKPSGWLGYMFDPRVIYSVIQDKYVIAVLGRDDANQTSHCFVAVSQSNDPTGLWWMWRFDQDAGNPSDADSWWDYESLGADQWGLYLTGNYYYWVGGWKYSMIWSIGPDVFNGGVAAGWRFWGIEWPNTSLAFSPQVMLPHSLAGGGETFFVNSYSGSGSAMCLWTMTGDRTNSPTLVRSSVGTWQYDWIGENVDQPGVVDDIDGGDARIMNGVYAQRKVFVTLTTDPADDGNQAGAMVTKIDVDSAVVDWQHVLWTTDWYYFYPAISIAGGGGDPNIALFSSYTGPSSYAGGVVKVYTDHPISGAGPFWVTATGQGSYVRRDGNNLNRWGDYSGNEYDWTTGHFWGDIEYAWTSNSWRTRVTAVTAGSEAPFSAIDVTYPNGGETFNQGDSVLVTWSAANIDPSQDLYVWLWDGLWYQQSGPLASTTTSFLWTVPGIATTTGRIYVGAWNGAGYDPDDFSDGVFTIIPAGHIFSDGFESGTTSAWSVP